MSQVKAEVKKKDEKGKEVGLERSSAKTGGVTTKQENKDRERYINEPSLVLFIPINDNLNLI